MQSKPYSLLLITAVLFFLSSFLVGKGYVDIYLHDTYLVFDYALVFRSLALVLIIYWIIYILTKRVLFSSLLRWIHMLTTILTAVVIISFSLWGKLIFKPVNDNINVYDFNTFQKVNYATTLAIFSLLLCQLLYFINLFIGLINRNKNTP